MSMAVKKIEALYRMLEEYSEKTGKTYAEYDETEETVTFGLKKHTATFRIEVDDRCTNSRLAMINMIEFYIHEGKYIQISMYDIYLNNQCVLWLYGSDLVVEVRYREIEYGYDVIKISMRDCGAGMVKIYIK